MVEQKLQAKNKEEVAEQLKSKGLKVLVVKKAPKEIHIFKGKVKVFDKANFCRYLSIMLRSGLSMSEAVEVIHAETENPRMKEVLNELMFEIQKGGKISTALKRYPNVFDTIFLALVDTGEQSGSLEKTFDYLSKQLYASHRINKKIKGAMMYPMVILTAMFGVGFMMVTFVLPKLSGVFLKMKIPLPAMTRLMLNFGVFVEKNTGLVVGLMLLFVLMVYGLFAYYKTRKYLMNRLSNAPLINRLFKKIDLARFTQSLAVLLKSGVPIIKALQIASGIFSQFDMQKQAKSFQQGLTEGKSIAAVLTSDKKVFPSLLIQTIHTGEKTGTLDDILMELSEFYEAELEDALKEFTTILEPLIMLIIGVAVGAMVIMIIAPIYSILGGLQVPGG